MLFRHEQDRVRPLFIWTNLKPDLALPSDDRGDAFLFEMVVALNPARTWHKTVTIKEAIAKRPPDVLTSREAWWASTLRVLAGQDPKGRISEDAEPLLSVSFGRHDTDMAVNPPSQITLQWKDTLGGFPVGFDRFNVPNDASPPSLVVCPLQSSKSAW